MSTPPPLYHGTRTAFRKGGFLFPGDEVGKDNHGLGRSDAVYVTPDKEMAREWALAATGRARPRILTVRPNGPLEPDDSTVEGQEHEAYRCTMAKVLAVEIIEET